MNLIDIYTFNTVIVRVINKGKISISIAGTVVKPGVHITLPLSMSTFHTFKGMMGSDASIDMYRVRKGG